MLRLGLLLIVAIAYSLTQLYAGWCGLHHVGLAWLIVGCICLIFRFTLPFTIGAAICAHTLWGWSWFWACIFAAPGLLFILPALGVGLAVGALGLVTIPVRLFGLLLAPFKAMNRKRL